MLGAVALIAFAACSPSPNKTAEKAAKAIQTADWQTYYELLSAEDKELKSEQEVKKLSRGEGYQAEVAEVFPEVVKELKVKNFKAETYGDTAKVTYIREILDLDKVYKESFDFDDIMQMGSKKVTSLSTLPDNMKEKIAAYLRSNEIPKTEREEKMMLVKENKEWKVFRNFAFPARMKEARKVIDGYMESFNYAGAKSFIHDFNERFEVEEFQEDLNKIENLLQTVTIIGQPMTIGSLEFTPIAIQIRKVPFTGSTYSGAPTVVESAQKYMVLQYKLKNVSKAQTFAPRNVPYSDSRPYTWVLDSHKNRMRVASTKDSPNGNMDTEVSKSLEPGKEVVYHAVVSTPSNEQADAYLWAVRLRVNNAADAYEDVFHFRFEKKDIPFDR